MGQKLFVTDLDGTLLNDSKSISSKDLDTLQKLKDKNVIIAIATGRSDYSFNQALLAMGGGENDQSFPIDYIIFSTGAGILQFPLNTLIYQKTVDNPGVQKVITCFDHNKIDYMLHKAIPENCTFVYKSFGAHNPDFNIRLELYKKFVLEFPDSIENFGSATQVLGIIPKRKVSGQINTIRQELDGFSVILATSPLDHQSSWVEVFHKDVSKSQTVSWLANRLGILQKDVISVGNDYNDEDLLSWSGEAYVVDNAPKSLKNKFKIVSSNNHSGVSNAVAVSELLVSI